MKALLVDPEAQTIEPIEIQGKEDIVGIIGYDTITSDEIGPEGDRLFFDEECFLRGTTGRFQIDTVIPVAGKGIIIGADDDGNSLKDVTSGADEISSRIKYL
jgi:di/tripeptidase